VTAPTVRSALLQYPLDGERRWLAFLVELDPNFHFKVFRARAQTGQADAQYSLGNRYARGEGVAQVELAEWPEGILGYPEDVLHRYSV